MAEEDQHHSGAIIWGDHMCRVANDGVLLLSLWDQLNPGLVCNVEHPQLIGNVPGFVYLASIHVELILGLGGKEEVAFVIMRHFINMNGLGKCSLRVRWGMV